MRKIFYVEPPDKPPGVDVTNKGSRSITIAWTSPYSGNSPISKYIIEYKTAKGLYGCIFKTENFLFL